MNWARPELLNLLWAIPVIVLGFGLAFRSRRRALAALGPLMSARISSRATRIHAARATLWTLALASIFIALAQPRWDFQWQELRQEGLSLVVVLDVSRSMDAEDVSPSRMERARREVRDLAGMLAGDRVGLVLSAGGAYAQMPLTQDYAVLDALARRASSDILRAQGSDLSMAIDKAMELLSGDEQTGDRAILILSDGEDHGDRALAAAQRAADDGVFLYTIGIGTPSGAPIPVAGGGFKQDRTGQVVITRLEEDLLQEIAAIGQGAYVRSIAGAADMQTIYQEQIRGQLTAAEQGVRREKIWTERYMLFLALGLALIVVSFLLRPGSLRLGPAAAASVLLLTVGTARADTLDDLLQQQAAAPDDMALAETVGGALFQAGRYDEAARVLEQVAQRGETQQQDRARYNAGLARYYAGQLTAALEDWQHILNSNPDHTAAQQNAAAVEAEIQARLQEQQEQQEQQQQSDEECDNPEEGDGESQDSESQDSESQDSESQDSESQDSESQDSESQDSESHDGTMEPPSEESLADQLGDTGEDMSFSPSSADSSSESSEASSQVAQGEALDDEALAEEAARRLLGSVDEGEPRVTVGDKSRGGNDW